MWNQFFPFLCKFKMCGNSVSHSDRWVLSFTLIPSVKAKAPKHVLLRFRGAGSGAAWGTSTPESPQATGHHEGQGFCQHFPQPEILAESQRPKPVKGPATAEEGVGVPAGARSPRVV